MDNLSLFYIPVCMIPKVREGQVCFYKNIIITQWMALYIV